MWKQIEDDQRSSDADQAAADDDQGSADADETTAATDQTDADRDQAASDRDQVMADRVHDAPGSMMMDGIDEAYEAARKARRLGSIERLGNRLRRATSARDRDKAAGSRDRSAQARDETARSRDSHVATLAVPSTTLGASLLLQLQAVSAAAAADRELAAVDRLRAASDRDRAARERSRLEAELQVAHLDGLTGAYRREMGELALANEVERARRSATGFVLAFVDVDRLKQVNDREGHAAGDRALQGVVAAIRLRLRSFDPIVRYGGDEFLCGLGGTDLADATRRFEVISAAIEADARVGISVGLVVLEDGESLASLTERADVAMLAVKDAHHRAADAA